MIADALHVDASYVPALVEAAHVKLEMMEPEVARTLADHALQLGTHPLRTAVFDCM